MGAIFEINAGEDFGPDDARVEAWWKVCGLWLPAVARPACGKTSRCIAAHLFHGGFPKHRGLAKRPSSLYLPLPPMKEKAATAAKNTIVTGSP